MSISIEKLQKILDEAYEAIYVTDFQYNVLYANKMASSIGKRIYQTDMMGEKCYECLIGRDSPCPFCKMNQLSEGEDMMRNFTVPSGHVMELRGKIIDWDGIPAHIEYIRDITDQKLAEDRSEELSIQQKNILNNISGGFAVYQIHENGIVRRLMFTDSLCDMQGYTRREYEELGADNVLKLVCPGDQERLKQALRTNCRQETAFSISYRVQHKEKGYIWVDLTATPIGIDTDGCMRYNAAFTNASQQFDLYRNILDNSENGVVVTDRNTREIYFTNASADSILDAAWNTCDIETADRHSRDKNSLCEICRLLPSENGILRKEKVGDKTYQVYSYYMDWMGRPAAAQYFSDITEEMELQSKLSFNEERYRLVVEKSGIGLIDYDMRNHSIYTNDYFRQYEVSASMNLQNIFEYMDQTDTVYTEDVTLLDTFYRKLEKENFSSARLRLKLRDGSYRWTEMNALKICDKDGQMLRKIGFFRDVDDITRQYEDMKIRYDYEMARQSSFENGVVERMLLDLTDDKIIHAANPQIESLTTLIGMSIEDLVETRMARTQTEEEKAELSGFMNREALLQAYYTGEHLTLDMLAPVSKTGDKKYYTSSVQLAKNPGNGHIIAFIETKDNDRAKMESTLMRRLLETNYESAIVFDAATGKIKIQTAVGDKDFATDIDRTFDEFTAEDILCRVDIEEREQVKQQISLATIRENLKYTKIYSGRAALKEGGEQQYKMWTAVYFDDARDYILLTIANVTEVYKRDLQTARNLKAALENAEVASKAKNTFLARMSHEIRTPITTVSGIMDLIRMACRKNDVQVDKLLQQVDTADAANQYLLTLINDILDISKIESNQLHLNPALTDIREVIRPMCAMIQPLADKKHIHFELQRKSKICNWYKFDAVRLQQILMNLLNNAIKFTPEGGTVTFTGEVEDIMGGFATVKFVVSDTGVGISDEFRDEVFEPFRQEYTDSKSGYGGTGIGLSISRHLAQLMGGDITFESEKNKGATFTARMKLEIGNEPESINPLKEETDHPQLQGLHILLCEDNEINQLIIRQILEAGGCQVTTADDGQQAVDQFSGNAVGTYDMILMDVQMPRLDGLEATRRIRAMSRADALVIPIVAMSANAYEEDRQMSLVAGMNEHLSKPVDTQMLYQTICKYCKM